MNRYIANTCKAIIALIIAASSISCASHSSKTENVDLVGLWKCSRNSEREICFTPKGHVYICGELFKAYKIEGDRLFYKLPGTEDEWKSVSFEMVSEDIFIFNNSSVFIRKK